jgi:hypothetical protein
LLAKPEIKSLLESVAVNGRPFFVTLRIWRLRREQFFVAKKLVSRKGAEHAKIARTGTSE